ncbi:MAG: ABC transporter permease [Bacteroidota bacterium]
MFKNNLKTALRYLYKNRIYASVNIIGLSLGMAAFLLIFQYVGFQNGFDSFHSKSDRIYRVAINLIENNEFDGGNAANYAFTGEEMITEFPEVSQFCRLRKSSGIISYNDVIYGEDYDEGKVYFADQGILTMFDFSMQLGNPATALNEPNSVVLSRVAAEKLFNNEDPLGKVLKHNSDDYVVTGVVDVPLNSHIQFEYLFSIQNLFANDESLKDDGRRKWLSFYTYVLINDNADAELLESKLPEFYKKHCLADYCDNQLFLQPLEDIYLKSDLQSEIGINGDDGIVFFLTMLAFFVLIIAWINYVSLATAGAMKRYKEVGIRLTLGAKRELLISRFLSESLIINIVAAIIGFILANIGARYLQEYIGISWSLSVLNNLSFWALILIFLLVGSVLSGLYPALVLSFSKPSSVLKGLKKGNRGFGLRKALTVFQFVFSIFLIVGTISVSRQMNFMQNYDLGFETDQIVALKVPGSIQKDFDRYSTFKNRVSNYASIGGVTGSTLIPGKEFNISDGGITRLNSDKVLSAKLVFIDSDFPKVYGMEVLEGEEFFEKEFEGQGYVLNESAAKLLDINDIKEKEITLDLWGNKLPVVGIMKDYYQNTAKVTPEPIVFICVPSQYSSRFYISLKTDGGRVRETVDFIESSWKEVFPEMPFEFFFVDEFYNQQYKSDQQFMQIFKIFTYLSILIFGLGLFGLALFNAIQRTKEIGIRKTYGASTQQILYLFLRDMVKLVVMSCLIAWPISYYFIDKWLEYFSERVALSWWWFPVSGLVVTLISCLVISYHTLNAARLSPVISLKEKD